MQLSKTDTLVLKGVALLLLLSHHLFYKNPGLYNDITLIGNHQLVQSIGVISKVRVYLCFSVGIEKMKKKVRFDSI